LKRDCLDKIKGGDLGITGSVFTFRDNGRADPVVLCSAIRESWLN